jgi:spore maturation protein CgeB
MRILLVHPGASWSTADVEAGLRYGLEQHDVEVIRYRLDTRLDGAKRSLYAEWRKARKQNPEIVRPSTPDMVYRASVPILEKALRHQVNLVLIVSAMLVHPDIIILLKRAGLRVAVLFTESPYDHEQEMAVARIVDGCWTNERTVVEAFRVVNPNTGYLPHAWHPGRHYVGEAVSEDVPQHDVVFVGSGFSERIAWFNAIDWSGIDLGLYGTWKGFGLKRALRDSIRAEQINNVLASAIYRRAKIGLNLYRSSKGWGRNAPQISHAESLSPRAYELAACGSFHLSAYRAEVPEVFGDLVPTFTTPAEAERLIRHWLADDVGRARIAAQLPACVAESSWVARATHVIGDVQALLQQPARSAA